MSNRETRAPADLIVYGAPQHETGDPPAERELYGGDAAERDDGRWRHCTHSVPVDGNEEEGELGVDVSADATALTA